MKLYAVIGNPISHSKSPLMMNPILNRIGMDALYTRILTKSMTDFKELNEVLQLQGFNVTAPFKKDIVELADGMDKNVSKLKVANTLAIDNTSRYMAYNTDVSGAVEPIKNALESLEGKKVMVFGAGGAAKAVVWGFLEEGCSVFICNRTMDNTRRIAAEFGVVSLSFKQINDYIPSMDIIVNTIPKSIPFFESFHFNTAQIVLDAAYKTAPLKSKAQEEGAVYLEGEQWLAAQARHAFKRFTGRLMKREVFAEILDQKSEKAIGFEGRIALIGPMGAGKTLLGSALAEMLQYDFLDLDAVVEKNAGVSIKEIFETKGEEAFRKLESEVLLSSLAKEKIVISCGGGVVIDSSNRKLLKKYCHTYFLSVRARESIRRIKDNSRPLLQTDNPVQQASELIRHRLPLYLEVADVVVNSNISSAEELKTMIYDDYRKSFQ